MTQENAQKLEITYIGKGAEHKLEPPILIEKQKAYSNKWATSVLRDFYHPWLCT